MTIKNLNIGETVHTIFLLLLGLALGVLLSSAIDISSTETNNFFVSFVPPIFASLLGASAAYFGIKRNQLADSEARKVGLINQNIYKIKTCLVHLCTIKSEYIPQLSTKNTRGLNIKRLLRILNKIDPDVSELLFLSIQNHENGDLIDLNRIDTAYHNFNLIIDVINTRNDLYQQLIERAEPHYTGGGTLKLELEKLYQVLGKAKVDQLLHMSEMMIILIDENIIELYEVAGQLQEHSAKYINKKLVSSPIIMHFDISESNDYLKSVLEKVPELDTPLPLS